MNNAPCVEGAPNSRAPVTMHRGPVPEPTEPGWLRCLWCHLMFRPTSRRDDA